MDADINFVENLINNVKNHKCLYDKRDDFYCNHNFKEKAWKEISENCTKSVEECKHRWKLLCERFVKELKKVEAPPGNGMHYLEEWIHLQSLMFLKDSLAPRRTCENVEEVDFEIKSEPHDCIEDSLQEPSMPAAPCKKKKTGGLYQNFGETIEKAFSDAFFETAGCLMRDLPEDVKEDFQSRMLQELYSLRREHKNITLKSNNSALDGICVPQEIIEVEGKRKRSCSVKETNRDRKENGFFAKTFLMLKEIDHQQFFIYTRMTPRVYELLLELVKPHLERNSGKEPVESECRLAVTLLYLSQGTPCQSLARSFKLGKETVRKIILETTEVFWKVLSNPYVCEPNETDYLKIAEDFWELWNIPNCIGAVDGKHIAIQSPNNCDSHYKNIFSVVIIATCDARYRFSNIDIGTYGSLSDGGIFQLSKFGKRLINKALPIPPSKALPNTQLKLPHFFVGGAAFPLGTNLMRPYPGKILPVEKDVFNKRLSRACRTIENAFGILTSRWQVLLTTLHMYPENAEKIVLGCVSLHNFIMLNDASSYAPTNYVDWEDINGDFHKGTWRRDTEFCIKSIKSIKPSSKSHQYGGKSTIEIRKILSDFFQTG